MEYFRNSCKLCSVSNGLDGEVSLTSDLVYAFRALEKQTNAPPLALSLSRSLSPALTVEFVRVVVGAAVPLLVAAQVVGDAEAALLAGELRALRAGLGDLREHAAEALRAHALVRNHETVAPRNQKLIRPINLRYSRIHIGGIRCSSFGIRYARFDNLMFKIRGLMSFNSRFEIRDLSFEIWNSRYEIRD